MEEIKYKFLNEMKLNLVLSSSMLTCPEMTKMVVRPKMSKITPFLWKDFVPNFMLAEGL